MYSKDVGGNRRHALLSWIFLGALIVLSATLGILQYRWIGEVSRAERDRLRETVQANLRRLSQDFNAELTVACTRILPERPSTQDKPSDEDFATHYLQWRDTSRHSRLFRAIALAVPKGDSLELRTLDLERGTFSPAEWPREWGRLRSRLEARLQAATGNNPRGRFGITSEDSPSLIELPYFSRFERESPQPWRELQWVILDLNLEYVRETMIPELLHRHLGGGGDLDFDAEIVMREMPSQVIFDSDAARTTHIESTADASVLLFDVRPDVVFRRAAGPRNAGPPGEGFGGWRGRRGPPPDGGMFERGRWQLFVRHRSGSLEAVVAKARTRNLLVSTAILLLLMAAVVALLRFTRRAQKLAELQMEFVAGVSHELRTPLSVMRTAGHNLQGRVSSDPVRVQRYGALIQEESEKLTAIVEQVLRFANANAGRVIGGKEEIQIGDVIDQAIESIRRSIDEAHDTIDKRVDPDLPSLLADPNTLQHAVQNLISNAVKYGCRGDSIEVCATSAADEPSTVEIRVTDHGEGIAPDEIGQIFEPFYRGKKAIEEQIHGTGLGLSLTKRIVEAHGGTIEARSEQGKGSTFIMRIPALPVSQENEFADSIDRG